MMSHSRDRKKVGMTGCIEWRAAFSFAGKTQSIVGKTGRQPDDSLATTPESKQT
jgi:hypothetical protein